MTQQIILVATSILLLCYKSAAALLAYEPFTNATGTALIGSGDGSGFTGVWQSNSSSGVATNLGYGLGYTDAASNSLVTVGGAGFFQGLTSANNNMQPIRLFDFSRGTNGTDGGTTWISFLVFRTGPTGTLSGNAYGRGANVPHDINTGALQKLSIGNGSGALSNTVALIPQGSGGLIKGATNIYGGVTNFVVVRIDHVTGTANDNAYLFVNPSLASEPSTNNAGAISTNMFDYSFDRVRVFAGGQNGSAQPYAELVLDEYRIGETFADIAPIVSNTPPVLTGPLVITNAFLAPAGIVLSGNGGSNNAPYFILATTNIAAPLTNWLPVATNTFDVAGNFIATNPTAPGAPQQFFRLLSGNLPTAPIIPPTISTQPTNQTVNAGQTVSLIAAATGGAPLSYQWFFNTSTALPDGTNATYGIASAQAANEGSYTLRVTNSAGSVTSVVATLTVNVPPSITTQPQSQTVTVSNIAAFTVVAAGDAPLRYQWYFNTNTTLLNATNATYVISNAQTNNAGTYSVIMTNNFGAVTSSIVTLTVTTNPVLLAGAYFVSPTGNDANPGTVASPFLTILKGLNTITTSGTLYLRGGNYAQPAKLSLTRTGITNGAIRVWAYPGETPVVNSSGNSSDGIAISGRSYHLKGITITLAGHNGINISGHSNVIENCVTYSNGNTGLHLTGSAAPGPTGNLILNCDSYLNYDPPAGGNADGFSAKWDIGPGNIFSGCRAWWNSDDGWDLWMGTSTVVIDQSWAFANGTNYWGNPSFNGNGNGFKLGGNSIGTPHLVKNCVAFDNTKFGPNGAGRGFDENNNLSGQTLYNCIAYRNTGNNYHFGNTVTNGQHVVRNCISYVGNVNITSGIRDHNSWNGFTVSVADFQSLDVSQAKSPRNADGTVPVITLFRLNPASSMMDAGVDVGLPYTGAAPDLGAFEDGL